VTVTLVADAGPDAGLGHLRRVGALATALAEMDVDTRLVRLESGARGPVDAEVAVVDSYHVRADDPAVIRAATVCAIDELGRDLAVALAVDPTPGAVAPPTARADRVLAGSAYALVDPAWSVPSVAATADPDRVLVTFGATAAADAALAVAADVISACPGTRVTVAIGPHHPDASAPCGAELVTSVDGLDAQIRGAGIVVCAGGVTVLEACAAGRPVVAVVVAPNQAASAEALVALGAVEGATIDDAAAAVRALRADPARRDALATTARATIDGLGARRIAGAVVDLLP
jgi:spore coat polysaccharide biosynthesis predicted glycosyltransferase SpsG